MAKNYSKRYQALTEGINANVSDSLMVDGELVHSTNTTSTKIGVLSKCKGQSEYWDIGSAAVTNLTQFGSGNYAVMSTSLYKKGTSAAIVTGLTAGSPLAVGNDHIFYALSSGTAIGSYNGTAASARNLINAPSGTDTLFANGKLYIISGAKAYISSPPRRIAATIVSDHATASTTIHVSSTRYLRAGNTFNVYSPAGTKRTTGGQETIIAIVDGTTFTMAASDEEWSNGDEIYFYEDSTDLRTSDVFMWNDDPNVGSWFEIDSDTGDYVTAIEQLGTVLFFYPNEVKRFDEATLSSVGKTGTTSGKTVVSIGRRVFFANSRGIYMVDGNDIIPISSKMDPYFAGISDYSVMCAGAEGNLYRLFIGDTTHESLEGVEIVLDTTNMKYELRTGIDAETYAELVVSNEHDAYLGTSDGSVMQIGDGTDYDGSDFAFSFKTKWDDLGDPNSYKLLDRVVFKSKPGALLDVAYSLDHSLDYLPLGQIQEPIQSFDLSDKRCNSISFFVSEISSDTPPEILEYSIFANQDEEE